MSATNRGRERNVDDAYMTPGWAVKALLQECRLPGGTWLEPCAGDGAIVRATQAVRDDVVFIANDTRSECYDSLRVLCDPADVTCRDYLVEDLLFGRRPRVIITNPPYSLAMEFIKHSLGYGAVVAMLLRLPFLASQKRAPFFRDNCPDVYVLPKRPSFLPDGKTDATDYAWFVWGTVPQRSGRVQVLEVRHG